MIWKVRLILLTILMVPQILIFLMTYQSYLAVDKFFNQVEAVSLAVTLLIVFLLPGVITQWLVVKPINRVKRFCSAIKEGNYRERLGLPNESSDGEEEDPFTVLIRNLNWMARQIEIRETELQKTVKNLLESRQYIDRQNQHLMSVNKELLSAQHDLQKRGDELEVAYQKMRSMAITDPLTKIANRRHFFDELHRIFKEMTYCHKPLSMVMIDIDYFKKVNDTYGHAAGDQVLIEVARILQANTRKTDLAARVGGEEYALLLSDTNGENALEIVARIKKAVAAHVFEAASGQKISVTISAGICTLTEFTADSLDALYTYADQALYFSKHSGRNSISIFHPDNGEINKANCA